MKIRLVALVFIGTLFLLSIAQIFGIYPRAETMVQLLKSGYFSELDRQFRTITDAFLAMKLYGQNEHASAFLRDIAGREQIDIRLFNEKGEQSGSAGASGAEADPIVRKMVQTLIPAVVSDIRGLRYFSAVPITYEKRCLICHQHGSAGALAGVMTFERPYDAAAYYGMERGIIFSLVALGCAVLFVVALFWDPDRRVKELFDK
jgi:hypothetical protein